MTTKTQQHEKSRAFHFDTLDDFQNSVNHIMKLFPDLKVSDRLEFCLGDPQLENYLQIVATGVNKDSDTGKLSLVVVLEPTIGTTFKALGEMLQYKMKEAQEQTQEQEKENSNEKS